MAAVLEYGEFVVKVVDACGLTVVEWGALVEEL